MKDLFKQLEKSVKKEVKKLEKSFTEDFNIWINKFVDSHDLNVSDIEVSQNNKNRFAELSLDGKVIAYATIENNRLKFHDLI